MADLTFYMDTGSGFVAVPPPKGWQDIEIELSFENNTNEATVRTYNFEWEGQDASILYKWFKGGYNGSTLGVYYGPGFRIGACSPEIIVFDGCINLATPETTFQCDRVKASCVECNRIQGIKKQAESVTFSMLKNMGLITNSDYVSVPYVINSLPDYEQVALLSISFVEIYKLLRDAWHTLEALIDTITGDTAAATATGGLTTAQLIADIIIAALYVLYITALIIILIDLLNIIINNIIQPLKYKKGMRVVTLFQKACSYLNLAGFVSSILQSAPYNNAVIIPKKNAYFNNSTFLDSFFGNSYNRKLYDDNLNPNSYGYYEGTFYDLIREMEDVFNARATIRIIGNQPYMYFERWDNFNIQAQYTLPNQSSDAPFDDPFGTNADENKANYYVVWTQDSSDYNTFDQYDGTSCMMTLTVPNAPNIRQVMLDGITQKRLNYALAKRKTDLTVPEKIVGFILSGIAIFYNVLVSIVNFFGGNLNPLPTNPFGARIGAMLLTTDYTSVQKFLVIDANNHVDANNQLPNHLGYTDAYALQVKFHSASWAINTLTSPVTYPNQYLIFKDKTIPLCCSDFMTIKNNNIINTYEQKKGRIDSLTWNPHKEIAKANYRVQETYDKMLTQTFVIDGN